MGKIKQKNYKYHSSAPVPMDMDSNAEQDTLKQPTLIDPSLQQLSSGQVQNNVFRNLVIPPSVLKQELPHVSSQQKKKEKPMKTREPFPLTMDVKKMLRAQRHLGKKARSSVSKVAAECERKREEDLKAKKQKKEAVLSDWQSLKDALTEPKPCINNVLPPSRKKTRRARTEKQLIQDLLFYQAELEHMSRVLANEMSK